MQGGGGGGELWLVGVWKQERGEGAEAEEGLRRASCGRHGGVGGEREAAGPGEGGGGGEGRPALGGGAEGIALRAVAIFTPHTMLLFLFFESRGPNPIYHMLYGYTHVFDSSQFGKKTW